MVISMTSWVEWGKQAIEKLTREEGVVGSSPLSRHASTEALASSKQNVANQVYRWAFSMQIESRSSSDSQARYHLWESSEMGTSFVAYACIRVAQNSSPLSHLIPRFDTCSKLVRARKVGMHVTTHSNVRVLVLVPELYCYFIVSECEELFL